jgi:hypothetical protein
MAELFVWFGKILVSRVPFSIPRSNQYALFIFGNYTFDTSTIPDVRHLDVLTESYVGQRGIRA